MLTQDNKLQLQFFLLATEMMRICGDREKMPSKEELDSAKEMAEEYSSAGQQFNDLRLKLDDIAGMAMDFNLTPRSHELNDVSLNSSFGSYRAPFKKEQIRELSDVQNVLAGQNNILMSQRPILSKELEELKVEIKKLNELLVKEGGLTGAKRDLVIQNLERLCKMKFADTQDKMVQASSVVQEDDKMEFVIRKVTKETIVTDTTPRKRETELENEADDLRRKLQDKINECNELRKGVQGAGSPNKELVKALDELREKTRRITDLEGSLRQAQNSLRDLPSLKNSLAETEAALRIKDDTLKEVRRKLKDAELKGMEADSLRQQLADTEERLQKAEKRAKDAESSSLSRSTSPLKNREVDDLRDEVKRLQNKIDSLQNSMLNKEKELLVTSSQLSKTKSELDESNKKLNSPDRLSSSMVDSDRKDRDISSLQRRLKQIEDDLQAREDQIRELRKKALEGEMAISERDALQKRLSELSKSPAKDATASPGEVERLKRQLDDLTKERDHYRDEAKKLNEEISALQNKIKNEGYSSSALKNRMESDLQDAEQQNSKLKQRNNEMQSKIEELNQAVTQKDLEIMKLRSQNLQPQPTPQPRGSISAVQADRLQGDLDYKKKQLEESQQELDKALKNLNSTKSQLSAALGELENKNDELIRMNKKLSLSESRLSKDTAALRDEIEVLQGDITNQKNALWDAKQLAQLKTGECERAVKEAEMLKVENEEMKKLLESSREKIKQAYEKNREKDDEISNLNAKISQLKREKQDEPEPIDPNALKKIKERFETELAEQKEEADGLRKKVREKQHEINTLTLELEEARQIKISPIKPAVSSNNDQIREMQSEIKLLSDELADTKSSLNIKTQQVKRLEEEMDSLRQEVLKKSSIIQSVKDQPGITDSDMVELNRLKLKVKELEEQAAFEGDKAKRQINSLADSLKAQTEECENLAKKLREKIKELNDIQLAKEEESYKADRTIKELRQELEDIKAANSNLLSKSSSQVGKENDLKDETERVMNENKRLKDAIDQAEDELAKAKRSIKQKDQQIGELLDKIEENEKRLRANRDSEEVIGELNSKIERQNKKLKELEQEKESIEKASQNNLAQLDQSEIFQNKIANLLEELKATSAREEELRNANSALRKDANEAGLLKEKLQQKERRMNEMMNEVQDLESKLTQARRSAMEAELNSEKAQTALKRLAELQDEHDRLQEALSNLRKQNRETDSLLERISALNTKLADVEAQRDQFKEQLAAIRMTAVDSEIAHDKIEAMTKKIKELERNNLDLSEKLSKTSNTLQLNDVSQEEKSHMQKVIDKLREQLNSLEEENLAMGKTNRDKQSEINSLELALEQIKSKLRLEANQDESMKDLRENLIKQTEDAERLRGVVRHKEREIEDLLSRIQDGSKRVDEINELNRDREAKLKARIADLEEWNANQSSSPLNKAEIERYKQHLAELSDTNNDLLQRLKEKQGQIMKIIEEKDGQIEQMQVAHQERHISNQRKLQEVILKNEQLEGNLKESKGIINEVKDAVGDRSISDRQLPIKVEEICDKLARVVSKAKQSEADHESIRTAKNNQPKFNSEEVDKIERPLKDSIRRLEDQNEKLQRKIINLENDRMKSNGEEPQISNLKEKSSALKESLVSAEKQNSGKQRVLDDFFDDPTTKSVLDSVKEPLPSDKWRLLDIFPELLRKHIRRERSEKEALQLEIEDLKFNLETKRHQPARNTPTKDSTSPNKGRDRTSDNLERDLKKKIDEANKYKSELKLLEDKYEDILGEVKRLREDADEEKAAEDEVGHLKTSLNFYEQKIRELEIEKDKLKEELEKALAVEREKRAKDRSPEEIAYLKKKVEDQNRLISELKDTVRNLEEAKRSEVGRSRERTKDVDPQLEVRNLMKPDIAEELAEIESENSPFGRFFSTSMRPGKVRTASRILEEFGQKAIKDARQIKHLESELGNLHGKLEATEAKYSVVKEAFLRAEAENKKQAEDLMKLEDQIHVGERGEEEQEREIRELLTEQKRLLDVIRDLTDEKEGLLHALKDLQKQNAKPKLRHANDEPLRESTVTDAPTTHLKRDQSRSPVKVDVFISPEDRKMSVEVRDSGAPTIPHMVGREGRSKSRSQLREESPKDKENIPQNTYLGKNLGRKMKKLLGAWTVVVELQDSYEGLLREFEKVNGQIQKDKSRMEHLCNKKPELTPYLKEIAKILSSPSIDQFKKTCKELEDSEGEYLNKSVGFFEKLGEEFGYIFGTYTEKLKNKKGDYIRWNKKLAAYCQQNYPQFGQN